MPNFFKENKEEIAWAANFSFDFIWSLMTKRQQKREAETLCGKCKLPQCVLLGKPCTLQDIVDCYAKQNPQPDMNKM